MRKLLVLVPALVIATAACGTAATPSPTAAAPTVAPTVAASAPAAGSATVMVADSDLGEILVDADGRTLYAFTDDTAGTPTCYDGCAANWPALLADGTPTGGEGLDQAALVTVARTDGGEQVKIGDWPLYYFASDAAAGDTNGQNVGGKWFVVSPTGELIR